MTNVFKGEFIKHLLDIYHVPGPIQSVLSNTHLI